MPRDLEKYFLDFRKVKILKIQEIIDIIDMLYVVNDWFFFPILWLYFYCFPTQLGLFWVIYVSCKGNLLCVNSFLLVTTHNFTFTHILKIFMKISINLEVCCFKQVLKKIKIKTFSLSPLIILKGDTPKFSFLSFEFFIHNSVNALKMNILDSERNKTFLHIKNKMVVS
jgi:hypothetical protein